MARSPKPQHVLERTGRADPPPNGLGNKDQLGKRRKRKGMGEHKVAATITDKKWALALQYIANGLTRPNVIKRLGVTRETFNAYTISHVNATKQMREAELAWLRRSWPMEELESFFSLMCTGTTVKAAALQNGWDEKKLASFYVLVRRDTAIREWYDSARELQAEAWMDDNIDISDNRGEDTYVDGRTGKRKPDHAVIQRDNLRIQTRQWTMAALNRRRFGDHKHIDHGGELTVNHAAVLGNARKRLEKTRQPVTIDNDTQQVSNG